MQKKTRQKTDTVFVLLIFCVFTASVLVVLMLGANIYKRTTELSQEDYDERTCLSYIWTKVKSSDTLGRVYTGEFHGLSALYLEEEYDGVSYQTRIYLYDGWVRELFSEAALEFYPEDGKPVIRCEALSFEQLDGGLIRASVGFGDLLISPRAARFTEGATD